MSGPAPALRAQSIRVALAATVVVAVIWAAVSVAVIAFATVDLTNQIDARLETSFNRLPPPNFNRPPEAGGPGSVGDRPFGPQTYVWRVAADGTVSTDANTPDLPSDLISVTDPQSAVISDVAVRVAGRQVGDEKVIVAQSLEPVQDSQRTILLGTLLIAPVLLISVFVGSVIVGRRVAGPIEAARERQLNFTADASHELRTPLSVIEAHASLALAQEREREWYQTAFGKVDREAQRMRRLLDDMLWLARFDATGAGQASEPVDLATVARQSANRFTAIAEMRGQSLKVSTPANAVPVAASADLLDRLVGVLLDNACKYAPDNGVIEVSVGLDGSRPQLSVDDSGPGIAEAELGRIFDRFHRSLATAGEADGAGLGLAIADAVVNATRGKWSIGRSSLGGARFSVRWPPAG